MHKPRSIKLRQSLVTIRRRYPWNAVRDASIDVLASEHSIEVHLNSPDHQYPHIFAATSSYNIRTMQPSIASHV